MQFYMHNLEDELQIKNIAFRYEWEFVLNKDSSTNAYFQKHKAFILGEIGDDGVNNSSAELVKDKEAPSTNAYFQKHKAFILSEIWDDGVNNSSAELVKDKEAPSTKRNKFKTLILNGIPTLILGAALALWIYSFVESTNEFKLELTILGSASATAFFLLMIFKVVRFIKISKNSDIQEQSQ